MSSVYDSIEVLWALHGGSLSIPLCAHCISLLSELPTGIFALLLLTERYLWSCRPLTSHIFCALFCLLPVHT